MYYIIVRDQLRKGFSALSQGDYPTLLKQFSPQVHFTFAGNHALGANLYSRAAVTEWFVRLHGIFPTLQLSPDQIRVSGLPSSTLVVTHFSVCDTLPDGSRYQNRGIQVLRLRWGQVIEDHLIEDTVPLVAALDRLIRLGVTEAGARPMEAQ